MHFTSTSTAIIASVLLLSGVNASALPKKSLTKRTAETGEKCFNLGEKTCNKAGDFVVQCLGPPGGDLEFGGIVPCVAGFTICDDGFCVLDPNRKKTQTATTTEATATSTASTTPESTESTAPAPTGKAIPFSGLLTGA